MRVIIITYALLSSCFVWAQKKKLLPPPPPSIPEACFYSKKYTDSALLHFYPFSRYSNIQLVSYRYHSQSNPIKGNLVLKDSLIENVSLSSKEVLQLADLLYNNYAKRDAPPQESLCGFQPRNAILFFDKDGRLRSSVLICFHCMMYRKSEQRINFGDECRGKLEKLLAFFVTKGVKFGTDMDVEGFVGEN